MIWSILYSPYDVAALVIMIAGLGIQVLRDRAGHRDRG
jgi:hypothetical protein